MTCHTAFAEGNIPLEGQPVLSTETSEAAKISALKKKINDEEYLRGAIQRIALIMSNEISGAARQPEFREEKKQ
jgi:hypothetical protein